VRKCGSGNHDDASRNEELKDRGSHAQCRSLAIPLWILEQHRRLCTMSSSSLNAFHKDNGRLGQKLHPVFLAQGNRICLI
jgi:hypothetical protein